MLELHSSYQSQVGILTIEIDAPKDFMIQLLESRIQHELNLIGLSAEIEFHIKKIELPKDKNKFKRFITEII